MRKFVVTFMAVLLVTAIASCTKDGDGVYDGVYNPAKKIHKCYYQDVSNEEKELQEIWNWNGSRLESIQYGHGSSQWVEYWTDSFTYEGNVLVRVNRGNEEYADFTYRDGCLYKIDTYIWSVLAVEYTFIYGDDNRLSEISAVYYFDDEEEASYEKHLNPLRLFLPQVICDRQEESRHRLASKVRGTLGMETGTISFTWSGDNISRVYYDLKYEEEDDDYSYIQLSTLDINMQYDTKRNPKEGFVGSFLGSGLSDNVAVFSSKNNVKNCVFILRDVEYENGVLDPDPYIDKGEYHRNFEYDRDGYPVTINQTDIDENGNSRTGTYFVEYL